MRFLVTVSLVLIAVLLSSCTAESRMAAGYAMKRVGAERRHTIYCTTSTYGNHSTVSCF